MTSWRDNISLQYIMVRFNLFLCLVYGVKRHFQQYFSYIVAVSFIGGGNRNTRRKPPICRKSLTNFLRLCSTPRPLICTQTYLFTLSSDIEDQRKY
jgi:hypothetical protein